MSYDFVPGQRTLFFTDFTEDEVGNFPQRLEYKTGGMEIVEFEGGQRALKASSSSDLIIPLPEVLPDANLKLSQARAEAMKAALTGEYGVSADQLTSKRYGDTKPAADNKTPEGRANYRRVELTTSRRS